MEQKSNLGGVTEQFRSSDDNMHIVFVYADSPSEWNCSRRLNGDL